MGTAGSKQVKPAPAVDDDGHAKTPWLPNKARISSPPLQKVIVYNRKDQSLQIIPEDSLKLSDPETYQKIALPPRQSEVAIFVDPETESKATTSNVDSEGCSNFFLVKILLDRLETPDRKLYERGLISSIYIINGPPQGSASSSHSVDAPALESTMA